jgi:hypothetical protein
VLSRALESNLQTAIVIGWDESGELYFASSEPSGSEILWLLENAKKFLMEYED